MPSEVSALPSLGLAEHLLVLAEVGRADSYYRLARMVARVLIGRHLQQRRKWCALARSLAAAPGVEERLVWQAMRWLEGRGAPWVHDALPEYSQPVTFRGDVSGR